MNAEREREGERMSVSTDELQLRITGCINKLLDKAGKDPRLTIRLLREKAEERLKMTKDELKPKRQLIKKLVIQWWTQKQKEAISVNVPSSSSSSSASIASTAAKSSSIGTKSPDEICLQQLNRLAKAVGMMQTVNKMYADFNITDKIAGIRKRFA